ncbi:MAG TPA: histidine phosphatase family protein [Candidatus Deferrimicrobiaceae bacterium]|nr:histidine phosphatase family protein [Candidatus Deferrimicrobiaceae bacterium]
MELWLVRHGEAMSEREDPARPLTPEGARAVSAVAESLAGKLGTIDLVAASGKKRAIQTAAIWAAAAGYPAARIAETGALSPNAAPEAFLAFLEECPEADRVLCVGHLPSIAAFASFFLSSGDPVKLVFGPGSVCRIRVETLRRGAGELLLFV